MDVKYLTAPIIISCCLLLLLFCDSCTAGTTNILQAYRQAAHNDPIYQQQLYQNQAIGFSVGKNRANLLPQLSSTTTIQQQYDILDHDKTYSDSVNFVITQNIFNWSYWKNLSAARLNKKAAQLDNVAQKQNLIQRLATSYFIVSLGQKQITLDQREINNEKRILRDVRKQYKSGQVYLVELNNAESSLAKTRARLLEHKISLIKYRNNLRQITGEATDKVESLNEIPFIKLHTRNLKYWLNDTINNNLSINSARFLKYAALASQKSSYSNYLPSVNASASYQYGRSLEDGLLQPNNHNVTVGLSLSWKLWQSGRGYYSVEQKKALYLASQQELARQIALYTAQCRSAFTRTIEDEVQIQLNIKVTNLDKQAYENTLKAYKQGIKQYTIKTVLDADENYYVSEYNLLRSEYDYLDAIIMLREASGSLSPKTLTAINSWLS